MMREVIVVIFKLLVFKVFASVYTFPISAQLIDTFCVPFAQRDGVFPAQW